MKATLARSPFGQLSTGQAVELFTLTNANGLIAKVTNYGTIITELHVPDRQGKLTDVVLGFDNLQPYLKRHPYFGASVGRVANRIAKGRFTLDGKAYQLPINNGPNHLHGGLKGFDKVLWQAEPQPGRDASPRRPPAGQDGRLGEASLPAAIKFTYTSPDGEEGYPGVLAVAVTMTLTDANELRLDYTATTDKPTPINLTNHSYFNLAGQGDVLAYELMIPAESYTPSDNDLIPTGEISPVAGTPMDFRQPQPIGARFSQLHKKPIGYDTNFVLPAGKGLQLAARVHDPKSGRVMEAHTTEPAIQFYSANFLDGSLTGKRGVVYTQYSGFCLEAQHFPDAVNQPKFPSTILRPGQTYRQTTVYKFLTPK
jgi:aldose 1-epimerase